MVVLQLTKEELDKLEQIKFPSGIVHTESEFFSMSKNRLIKVYNSSDKKYLNDKLKSLKNLLEFQKESKIPELVTPIGVFLLDDAFKGIILPKIKGKNSSKYLNSKEISLKDKIKILKGIGTVLEKIKNTNPKYNAAFSDVHSDNFLVTGNLGIRAIDTESMRIKDSNGTTNFYHYELPSLKIDKYEVNSHGIVKASYETDIYCYVMMILAVISNDNMFYTKSIDDYKKYLDYLSNLGVNNELLEAFLSIYKNDIGNINPLPYLDTLTSVNNFTK